MTRLITRSGEPDRDERTNPAATRLVAYDIDDFMNLEFPPRRRFVGKWLVSGSANLIHAKRGVGKSHLALWLGYSIAQGRSIFDWEVKKTRKVIFLDGEMHPGELKNRVQRIRRALGPIRGKGRLQLASALLMDGPAPDVSAEGGQQALLEVIGDADVVILDNLSSWDRTGREDADGWSRIQPWVQQLQKMDKAVILIHHSGKTNKQRGTSRREDNLDIVINLSAVVAQDGSGEACFDLRFEKKRHVTGKDVETKRLRLRKSDDGHYQWDCEEATDLATWHAEALKLHKDGLTMTEIAKRVGKNKSSVSRFLRGR